MVGASVKLVDLYADKELADADIKTISFKDSRYDENEGDLESLLCERMYLVRQLKAIYDWAVLSELLKNQQYISFAKVDLYEGHKDDLQKLKELIKDKCPDRYKDIFTSVAEKNNYSSYIGSSNQKKVKNKCTQEDFCKYIEKQIKDIDTSGYEDMVLRIQNRMFMPKQVSKDNGVIPYQLNKKELQIILNHASNHYAFLNEIDETGFSAKEKIMKILEFRIPYYVGPLNDAHKDISNCWIVKKENKAIRPWNFEQVVDLESSAENFIQRMTNKCTYLTGEDVLPKNSLLYSEFMVLNELNNLRIGQERVPQNVKKLIFDSLFKKYKKVTVKKLRAFLENEGIIEKGIEISGIDGDFKTSLGSYIDIKKILGDRVSNVDMIENLILWIVLFGDDKKLLRKRIKNIYANELSENEIKAISKLKYSGWGNLSKEFLEHIYSPDKETGEAINIITMLRNTNNNLMQILSYEYGFLEAIDVYNQRLSNDYKEITPEILDDLYVSPAVKRSIWQTLNIVREIIKITGHNPERIFVEMARGEDKQKRRTVSRKDKLIELYDDCKDEVRNWSNEIEQLPEHKFRSDRLYLYYTQMGRCMYSGDSIDIERLFDENVYDVDHIYPQSKVKDDSLDNRVLVKRKLNSEKGNEYPISMDWQKKQKNFWKQLLNKKFISKKKYERLTRTTPFNENELADFISRQVVETRQSTKAVASVLKQVCNDSEIVYVKAGNVSSFRQKYKLIKVRNVNDFHHAKDAYLNIVVGNVYHTKFTSNPVRFIKSRESRNYSLNRVFDFDVERNNVKAWKIKNDESISIVKRMMRKNNIRFTRLATEVKGGFFDQMLVPKGKGQMPIKTKDARFQKIERYGGYNKVSGAYFFLVEHTGKKNKRVRTIEYVPVYLAKRFEEDEEVKKEYLKNIGLIDARILIPKIKINSLFKVDGFYMHLSGRTGNQIIFKGANQLILSSEMEAYVKNISKFIDRNKKKESTITEWDKISKEKNLKLYDLLLDKIKNTVYKSKLGSQIDKLEKGRKEFVELTIEKQCMCLYNELFLFQCNSVSADLSFVGGAKNAGILLLSKDISNVEDIKIIYQSPTGLFENEVNLAEL